MSTDVLISTLLKNRGLTTPADISEFFSPTNPMNIMCSHVGLSRANLVKGIQLIKHHIEAKNKIAVYGDYDVDGICSTAILWENLHRITPNVFPHIPHRRDEGYGLSQKGIDHCLKEKAKLIITVDNGIVAHDQIAYTKSQGADVIIIDHHEPSETLPTADVIVHSTATCAAGLTWFFCRELVNSFKNSPLLNEERGWGEVEGVFTEQLSLVSLAVVCDIIPLIGINRSLVKFGLLEMKKTTRPGLLSLFELAKINQQDIDTYHLGFVIGPRINAMGRLEHAIDSLRLLCTTDPARAGLLAQTLDETNRTRQQLTETSTQHAINQILTLYPESLPKLLIVSDPSYDQGVIGLIAAKLVEKFYRPAIAISVSDTESKASARSVTGFHITDHLRSSSDLFLGLGGHAMAAGFTVPTKDLKLLKKQLTEAADKIISEQTLVRTHRFDMEVPLSVLDMNLYEKIQDFAPFGLGNREPSFFTKAVQVSSPRRLGSTGKHLRFKADNINAIWFNAPVDFSQSSSDFIYRLDLDTYRQPSSLQLVIQNATH
jgi:single-stranded-DNA-specific exonuclease